MEVALKTPYVDSVYYLQYLYNMLAFTKIVNIISHTTAAAASHTGANRNLYMAFSRVLFDNSYFCWFHARSCHFAALINCWHNRHYKSGQVKTYRCYLTTVTFASFTLVRATLA